MVSGEGDVLNHSGANRIRRSPRCLIAHESPYAKRRCSQARRDLVPNVHLRLCKQAGYGGKANVQFVKLLLHVLLKGGGIHRDNIGKELRESDLGSKPKE